MSADCTSLDAQIACVAREIALRERVYPRFVSSGRMTYGKSQQELETMRSVLATLTRLRDNRVRVVGEAT